jgi:hypothetical protein
LVLCLIAYAIQEGHYLWVGYGLEVTELVGPQILGIRDKVAAVCCGAYGLYRVAAFHPLFRPAYREWLMSTPWTSPKPLPLGPIHLVFQDVILLAVVVAMLHGSPVAFWLMALAAVTAYLTALTVTFRLVGLVGTFYGMAFGLGLALRLAKHPYFSIGVIAALYPLACVGVRRSLARFPWAEWYRSTASLRGFNHAASARATVLGWPFDQLRPAEPKTRIGLAEAALVIALVGWLLYAVSCHTLGRPGEASLPELVCLVGVVGCFAVRLLLYLVYHHPPLSLPGRIATFQWIIPGYDQALVAPICAFLAGVLVPASLGALGLPRSTWHSLCLAIVLFVCLAMPPSLRRWHLTGAHRLARGLPNSQESRRL